MVMSILGYNGSSTRSILLVNLLALGGLICLAYRIAFEASRTTRIAQGERQVTPN